MPNLKAYQQRLIDSALDNEVLCFGNFTLKSGRQSPYFFNTGKFNTGLSISEVGQCYAECIVDHDLQFDVLFGPAYKGIPLVTSTAIALSKLTGKKVPFCFDRKEVKDHGEGGIIVGAPLAGRVLVLDDVISKGVSIGYSRQLIKQHQAELAGIVIALDRQERGDGQLSAVQEVTASFQTSVTSIINLETLRAYSQRQPKLQQYQEALAEYQRQYGVG